MTYQTSGERVILAAGTGGYREYRIPGILPAPDGALLLTCEARAQNTGDWGDIDILVLRLTLGGEIETVLKIGESSLPPSGAMRTYNNPVLLPDGERIHLIYHLNYARAFILTSTDGGKHFGASREITAFYRAFPYAWNVCATGPGHGTRLQSGRLIVPVWLADGELLEDGMTRKHWPSVAGFLLSDDHGETWQPGELVKGVNNANETCAAQLPDGTLLLNFRNTNENRLRVLGTSKDAKTLDAVWAEQSLPDPMCFGGMTAGPRGALFCNCASKEKRVNVTVSHSPDGKAWRPVWHVDDMGGYADIAYRSGRAYVFYERYSYEKRIVEELVLKTGEER